MTLPLCYIAGPFNDPSPTIRRWHVDRAVLLARLAMACGYAPFELHTSILAGVYGDDSDPEQRKRGMEAGAAICRGVLATPWAVLWALTNDDGMFSDGVRAEWTLAQGLDAARRVNGWSSWRGWAAEHSPHLLPEWDRLAVRPDAVGEWEAGRAPRCECRRRADGSIAAYNDEDLGWEVYDYATQEVIAEGPETGAAGRAAADAALRAAGALS